MVIPFVLGMQNVQTLLDNAKTDRPERRTALVAKELAHYKVDRAALSEICLGCRTAQRMQLWLHFLLEWMQ